MVRKRSNKESVAVFQDVAKIGFAISNIHWLYVFPIDDVAVFDLLGLCTLKYVSNLYCRLQMLQAGLEDNWSRPSKYSIVFFSPSSNGTRGFQSRIFFARFISG